MKLLILLTVIACLQASARGYGQGVSLSLQNAPLEKAFKEIKKQTGYHFIYTRVQLKNTLPITCQVTNLPLRDVLDQCFRNQPLTYTIEDRYIVVLTKTAPVQNTVNRDLVEVSGRVVNESGEPLEGVTIMAKKSGRATVSNANGEFVLQGIDDNEILQITSIGYQSEELPLKKRTGIIIKLKVAIGQLDETIVMAYGKTSRRLNTGNISKVSSDELERQPVGNPLLALTGRVPGLGVTQSSGINGAAVKVQLRGQNSILQGSEPLYIIDGIPYAAGNGRLNQVTNATDEIGLSPFNLISIDNIESIEILKDADATAIYGSRGANGVIIITTKKGNSGRTKFTASINSGISKISRTMDMLNTRQYVQMRREAFLNDGLNPSANPLDPGYAPDIMVWDTSRYTDLKKLLIGGTAQTTNAHVSLNGGSANTQFMLGAAYQKQSTVFPTEHGETKTSVNFSLHHNSNDKKLSTRLTGGFLSNLNMLNVTDLTGLINLPPNTKLYDDDGKVNWQEKSVLFRNVLFRPNPLAALNTTYNGKFRNLISNIEISYRFFKEFNAKLNFGYNALQSNETSSEPSTSIDPNSGNLPSANFANRTQSSWIIEPHAEYHILTGLGAITTLVGATWQESRTEGISVQALNYSNDALLGSISGAGIVRTTNNNTQYRYTAFFGRLTYNFKDRYILNASGRRDGSSRFGPGNRFANFGAVGAAWLFSNERLVIQNVKLLSFGKIRVSYGITGNDQIGDYRYFDTWTASSNTYQGIPSTNPTALFNPNFSWESNTKIETAIELGFFSNRLLITTAFYGNRSKNQLISYTLPIQTGFVSVLKNLDALLQNQGLEIQLISKNISTKNLTWSTSINYSENRNKLLAFPGLSTSSYANSYTIGKSITTRMLYRYVGVDPTTGLYQFLDVDRNGAFDKNDRVHHINTDPRFFGGISNTVRYKGLTMSFFFEFRKQKGYNFISNNNSLYTPGYGLVNHPAAVLNRWQNPGDLRDIQKYTASSSSEAFKRMNTILPLSDANITDASFIRCKNISVSYSLPTNYLSKAKVEKCLLFVNAQNLFVITRYKGADPETQNMFVLPPLKTIVVGVRLTF